MPAVTIRAVPVVEEENARSLAGYLVDHGVCFTSTPILGGAEFTFNNSDEHHVVAWRADKEGPKKNLPEIAWLPVTPELPDSLVGDRFLIAYRDSEYKWKYEILETSETGFDSSTGLSFEDADFFCRLDRKRIDLAKLDNE